MADFISPFTLACATFDVNSYTSVTSVAAILEPITVKLAQSKDQRYAPRTYHLAAADRLAGNDWVRMMRCGQICENFGATLAELS